MPKTKSKTMSTTEARKSLPKLAKEAARRSKPADTLLDHAVEIRPRGAGRSAFLIPEVDIEATEELIERLYEEIEDMSLLRLVEDRVAKSAGNTTAIEDFARELGFDDLLEEGSAP